MGTGASTSGHQLPYGVPLNPRVHYADSRSKKENKIVRIDAPALVELRHGTVRYRFDGKDVKSDRREIPYDGKQDMKKKEDYFYHPRHNFRTIGEPSPQDSWKYCNVYKGPARARQQRLYYVFGKGLKVNNETGFIQSGYKPEEQSFQRPIFYKIPGHVYLDVIFLKHEEGNADDDDEDEEVKDPLDPNDNTEYIDFENLQDMEVEVLPTSTILDLQKRLARKLVKPLTHIHLYVVKGAELRSDRKFCDLATPDPSQPKMKILLHQK